MLEDQRYILEQILALLDETPVDGVLLAGDLYDKPVPPAEAVRLLDWFLTQLAARKLLEALGVRYALESQTLDTQTIDEPVYVRDRESRYATYTDERVPVTSGEPGYTVRVERVTLGEGGEELSRETISEDTYDPVAPAIYVGVTERE